MNLAHSDLLAVEREYCSRSLGNFARRAWPILEPNAQLKWGWCLDAICEHLEAVTSGEIKRLLINVPPGCMKSLLTNVMWPAWEWGPKKLPHIRHMGTAFKLDLAVRDGMKCTRLIQSEWYQSLFETKIVQDKQTKIENDKTGFIESMAFTSMTGSRGDRVRLDDPISVKSANSNTDLYKAELSFNESLPTRLNNPEESAIVVIMQRLHSKDISGIILDSGLPYTHLCIPMRFEEKRRCRTSIGWQDPRTKEGELMFPERFPAQVVDELETALGSYATAGQLQQRPTPRGGAIIKSEWIKYYQDIPKLEFRFITADTAHKTENHHDFSVFQCWGRSIDGGAYLLDQVRGKWEAPELQRTAEQFWHKHNQAVNVVPLRCMYVEEKASGTGVVQSLRRTGMAIVPVERVRDKISRAFDASPFIEAGNLYLPRYEPWVLDLVSEITTVPFGAHDDQFDPLADAISIIQKTPKVQTVAAYQSPPPIRKSWK